MKEFKKMTAIVLTIIMVIAGFQFLPKTSTPINATVTTAQIVQKPRINQGESEDITVWDCIWLGNYWQRGTNDDGVAYSNDTKKPIKWRVLDVDENNIAFVLADELLDYKRWATQMNVTWSQCGLRSWLNSDFYQNAFDENERTAICESTVECRYQNVSTYSTTDNLYVPSREEMVNVSYGFSELTSSDCRRKGLSKQYTQNGSYSTWFLRSGAEIYSNYYSYVAMNGAFGKGDIYSPYMQYTYGDPYYNYAYARPCMHIDLTSPYVRYAGVVQCHEEAGGALETATEEPSTEATTQASGYAITINDSVVAHVEENETYTLPVSGENNYYELGYIDDDNQDNVYKPGTSFTVTGDMNFTGIDTLSVTSSSVGASIKLDSEHPGIAFDATALLNGGNPVKSAGFTYGMLITAGDFYTERYYDEQSQTDRLDVRTQTLYGGKVLNITFGSEDWLNNSATTYRAGVLDVTRRNLSRNFLAKAYVTINYTDGDTTTIYSNGISAVRSIKQVAEMIKEDTDYYNNELEPDERAAVDTFAQAQ